MKKVSAISGVLILAFCLYNSISPIKPIYESNTYYEDDGFYEKEEPKTDSPDEFAKYAKEITTMVGKDDSGYPLGYKVRELKKARRNKSSLRTKAIDWMERGPGNVSGRTRGLIIHPDDPSGRTWIAGSASGGVWKTENAGLNWVNLTPDLPNLATTVVAMSPANTSIIYIGTGEGFFNSGSVTGDGIFKSVDEGQTWQQIVTSTDIVALQNVNRIIVDPENPDIVLACGNGFPPFHSGIFRSVDGGLSWEEVFTASARVQHLIADPTDFNIQYASINTQGIIKSIDGGQTWAGTGNGLSSTGRIELAISPSNTQRMYASVESAVSGGSSAVFISDDAGANWNLVGPVVFNEITEWLGEQGWYGNSVAVNPFDEDIVYVGGINIFKADVSESVRKKPASVTGVSELGTEVFMDWINAGLNYLRGGLDTGEEWFTDHEGYPVDFENSDFRSVEIRFGPDKKQMAHRFTVGPNTGAAGDGGAGVLPIDHVYRDYVEVPFEVWDVTEDRQLMVSFRDQEGDGKWNLITRSEIDPVPGREYIFVNAVTYDPDNPDPNITTEGGHGYKTMYSMWPTLAEGATFDDTTLPESKLAINYGQLEERISEIDQITTGVGIEAAPHVDIHNIQTFSTGPGTFKLIVATDGGLYYTTEEVSPGESESEWTRAGFGFNTSQFYGVDKKAGSSNYIGGTQDNGTWISFVPDPDASTNYTAQIGGDGFDAYWSYFEPDLVIGSSQNNRFRRSEDGGMSWQAATSGLDDVGEDGAPFFSRLAGHKLLPKVLLTVGASGVWRSNNFGKSWFLNPISNKWISEVITSSQNVQFSQANSNIVWAGGGMTDQRSLHVSVNGGLEFREVKNVADTLGSISGLATHPTEPSTAYVLFSFANYGKIFRTKDIGFNWEDISGFNGGEVSTNGFPDVGVNTLLVMPNDPQTIWVGTEIGVFESNDDGASWHVLDGDLPAVSVYKLIAVDDQVIAATHGRGIWTTTIPGLQWPDGVVAGVEDELEGARIKLFPNPADSRATITFEQFRPAPLVLSLTDATGRVVYENEYRTIKESGELEINTSGLDNGMYILSLKQAEGMKSMRLIIRH
jgi:photosystem II stability/assembly factor-like uncharacterized protein